MLRPAAAFLLVSSFVIPGILLAQNTFPSSGNVGIGTSSPSQKLEIASTTWLQCTKFSHSSGGFDLFHANGALGLNSYNYITQLNDGGIIYGNGNLSNPTATTTSGFVIAPWSSVIGGLRLDKTGNVGIGTASTNDANYRLFVETGIRTRKIVVDQATWPDYVFDHDYKLTSLDSVAAYIKNNSHLPDMPSADSIAANGVNLGDNQALLLKKVEELTLYVIQLQKTVDQQQQTINFQTQDIDKLKKSISSTVPTR